MTKPMQLRDATSIGSENAEIVRPSYRRRIWCTQLKHNHARTLSATGFRLQKARLRMRLRCNTLGADAGRFLPV
jgi:hypothetical protein